MPDIILSKGSFPRLPFHSSHPCVSSCCICCWFDAVNTSCQYCKVRFSGMSLSELCCFGSVYVDSYADNGLGALKDLVPARSYIRSPRYLESDVDGMYVRSRCWTQLAWEAVLVACFGRTKYPDSTMNRMRETKNVCPLAGAAKMVLTLKV